MREPTLKHSSFQFKAISKYIQKKDFQRGFHVRNHFMRKAMPYFEIMCFFCIYIYITKGF